MNKTATNDDLNISFNPSPNYAELAMAASGSSPARQGSSETNEGWMKGVRVKSVKELKTAMHEARNRVERGRQGMLVEALMQQRE